MYVFLYFSAMVHLDFTTTVVQLSISCRKRFHLTGPTPEEVFSETAPQIIAKEDVDGAVEERVEERPHVHRQFEVLK